jgi:acyl phosphate:glycerol-3-phosphate acyltransferase
MVEALKSGAIDIIVSSHDPQDVDTKRLPFSEAAPGAIGLETLLAAALRLHHNGEVPLMRLVEALSTAPARRFGLDAGTLKPGAAADLIIVDLDAPWVVREDDIRSRSKNTCFEGALMQGGSCKLWLPDALCFLLSEGDGLPMSYALAILFGYLLGSIPFGVILARLGGLGDLRKIGSGNIGATNVLRTGNKGLAALTLVLDALKGTAAVLIAGELGGRPRDDGRSWALLGHIFPVWLGFRGGKGVATYLGVLAPVFWPAALAFAAAWLLVAAVTRYSSLAALVATVVVPLTMFWMGRVDGAVLFALMTVLIFFKHSQNISRLLSGTESRIGSKG